MKRLISFILSAIVICAVYAQNIEVDGFTYSLLGNSNLKVIGGPNAGKVILPENIVFRGKTLNPVRIGKSAFANSHISEMVLPSTIIEIEDNAFSGSTIKHINFPENLKRIGKYAFSGTLIDSIFLPRSLANHPHLTTTGVDQFAFENCKQLRVVEFDCEDIPSKYTSGLNDPMLKEDKESIRVYYGAFDGCENIEKVICRGKSPLFALGWDQNYKSRTFPIIVLEFATLYCPAQYVEKESKWFDNVKPIPSTIEPYEQKKKKKEIYDELKPCAAKCYENMWNTGHVGIIRINGYESFYAGVKGLWGGDPKIKNMEVRDDKLCLQENKNSALESYVFPYRINKVANLNPDQWNNSENINVIDVISTEDFSIFIFRSREERSKEHYWLFKNNQIYRVDSEFYPSLKTFFDKVEPL